MNPAGDLRLAEQIVRFARVLRATGVKVGSGAALDAVDAAEAAGAAKRQDFYWTLHATLIKRHEDDPVFEQAFRLFWRRRDPNEAILAAMLPTAPQAAIERPAQRRVQEALQDDAPMRLPKPRKDDERELDMRGSVSDIEILRHKDFAQMSADELNAAMRYIREAALLWEHVPSRRLASDPRGHRIDLRRTLRASLRSGGELIDLKRRAPGKRLPPLVALLDISGSMSEYSRVVLHFLHALAEGRGGVSTFLFGTKLTNVTRALRTRDPDAALRACGQAAPDWSGGTWISSSLHRFNQDWSRRVLGQGAHVLLITDGLERETGDSLAREMDRLHRSSRRLIWLNPLLRYAGFEPKALGVRTMLPHVNELRPVHNLESLKALCEALRRRKRQTLTPPQMTERLPGSIRNSVPQLSHFTS